jgi:predicted nuclease of restriction endonuclease-like RecB superfamily
MLIRRRHIPPAGAGELFRLDDPDSNMLRKDLLRVSRAGGGYRPRFTDPSDEALAARVLGVYQGHVGQSRADLEAALKDIERQSDDFKLVRGFGKLLEREATFEMQSPIDPRRARRAAFEAAESGGVVTESERASALTSAADSLERTVEDIEASLFADLDRAAVLTDFETRYTPESLRQQYDLSLAQTALFDAVEVRIRSSDPKALVSAVKRLRLLYEIRRTEEGRELIVTGPDALFKRSRRYGTRFARLLRTVAKADEWRVAATIDDRGAERQLVLEEGDVSVPGTEPVTEPTFDSGVESDFYARFSALDLDWQLSREPEPLEAGEYVVIPDFAFDWAYGEFRVFFEIMGFWTPEYVDTKLSRFEDIENVAFLVAYDESLGVGEAIEARGHRAIPYNGTVRLKDIRDALRPYEADLREESKSSVPETLIPDADVVTLETLAEQYGVPESAIESANVEEHERVGRTLVRPSILSELDNAIELDMTLSSVDETLGEYGIGETSAVLSRLGYRIEWDGLGEGTVREK